MRIGQGFDAHKFGSTGSATYIRLGGVSVPGDKEIIAHSDGDVILHALCDALLGAIGSGDIGQHFPDTDGQYRNIDSADLLTATMEKVKEKGFDLINIDITVIAQSPKISPYRSEMQSTIAAVLGIQPTAINIKATTTEGMGFTGRGEGIAALAVVLLE